jgi:hypothetical protein
MELVVAIVLAMTILYYLHIIRIGSVCRCRVYSHLGTLWCAIVIDQVILFPRNNFMPIEEISSQPAKEYSCARVDEFWPPPLPNRAS